MAEDAWTKIEAATEAGKTDVVIDLCLALDEAERRSLAANAAKLERRLRPPIDDFVVWAPLSRKEKRQAKKRRARGEAVAAALACLGSPAAARRLGFLPRGGVERIVRARPRAWRDGWARHAVREEWAIDEWFVLRTLIREGECSKPEDPDYVRAMIRHVPQFDGGSAKVADNLRGGLLADPDLLREDVWKIFELEERTLAVGWTRWDVVLIELANDGVISRDRLIDETLGALRRDFAPGVAGSFSAFHDRLVPSTEEITRRSDEYVRLLSSSVDSTVGFALREVTRIDKTEPFDARALLGSLAPAVAVRPKGHVKRALALIDRLVKREPALAGDGLDLALDALSHETADIQVAGLRLIERQAAALREDQRARLAALIPMLDPSVRERAAELAGGAAAPATSAPGARAVPVPDPPAIDPDAIPRLLDPVEPIEDLDALLEAASVALERPSDVEGVERYLDGLSRLCDLPLPEGRVEALASRAMRVHGGLGIVFEVPEPAGAAALVTLVWVRRQLPEAVFTPTGGLHAALGRRIVALLPRIAAGRSEPLLSAPTHRGGFIDPNVLVASLEATHTILDEDLAQAVLRLAPDCRGAALDAIRALPADLPATRDAVALVERPRWPDELELDGPRSPARLLGTYQHDWWIWTTADTQRWLALVWPGRRELFYGTVARQLMGMGWHGKREQLALGSSVEPMLQPDEPLGPMALGLLAEVLGSTHSDRLLAADVVVEAIRTRRLAPSGLGRLLPVAMLHEDAVPDRWGTTLADVPSHGALHAHELQRVLEALLASLGDAAPRMTKVLDLLRRVAQDGDARVTDPAARAWLEARAAGGSKTAKLARAILEVSGDGAARSVEAAAAAHEADRERALRWSA